MKAIQEVINIADPNILWGDLAPQYKGYQLSNTGLVRSLKFYNKYPYGALVEPKSDLTYELSNDYNKRVLVSRDELYRIIYTNSDKHFYIPTTSPFIYTTKSSRNPVMFSKSSYIQKRDKIKEENNSLSSKVSLKLNIIDD